MCQKPLLRLAADLHGSVASQKRRRQSPELPSGSWDACSVLSRQVRRAELRGWQLAGARLAQELRCDLALVESQLAELRRELSIPTAGYMHFGVHDLYQDLVALEEEFEKLQFSRRERWLSVDTEPIVLEGIDLGPFQIRLAFDRDGLRYRVSALEPNPPQCRDNVTHPHVIDEVLCEGEGKSAIRQALADGRILDFFTLVVGILRTYNDESPYVELALWYSRDCNDCGAHIRGDDSYVCERCDSTLCASCATGCGGCGSDCCFDCAVACGGCVDYFCRPCLRRCPECQNHFCSGCLKPHERCSHCHENDEQDPAADCEEAGQCAEV